MLKMVLFACSINEKCCSVDGGRGICRLFSSPAPFLPSKAKKCQWGWGGWGGWAQVEMTDALGLGDKGN